MVWTTILLVLVVNIQCECLRVLLFFSEENDGENDFFSFASSDHLEPLCFEAIRFRYDLS